MFGILRYVPVSGGKPVEHLVSQRLTYVGRDKDCSVRLEDDSVDGKQFVISCSDQVKIQNLSRKVPTQVNQKSIGLREDQELRDKDTISFGNRKFLWIVSSSSGRRDPPKHDCLKGKRVSEPVRKVAVVTPNRRDLEDWAALPPDAKRRRTMDPSAAIPGSCFARRVRYHRQLKQMATPNRRKHSVARTSTTPAVNSPKKKSISFAQPLDSPQLTYNHETAFNKSITPGRFYRRNDGPFHFRGFNPVPEEPMSPGRDSFLSLDDSQMTRRSSARMSTPYHNKSMRGSSQLNKTQSPGPSGMYFASIQEEVTQHNQRDATPSSYFSSTSGSPRIMRAESPTILPGGSGSFQGRRSLLQSSRSSSYATPQEQSVQRRNDSMYVNASGSSQTHIQEFDGSSMNQGCYSWTTEGMSSPRADSFARTPPYMRTPRRSRGPMESPGSAAFSPNPSDANTSGYVLLSPRGRSIISRAFNRNDMSLQLSPQHSPSRRLLNFSPQSPDNRRHGEPAKSLSFQLLTKSLRKKLNHTPLGLNSPHNPMGSPSLGGRGKTTKNSEAFVEIPISPGPVLNGAPKSARSAGSRRAAFRQSSDPDLSMVSRNSGSVAPSPSSPVGAAKRKSSARANDDIPSGNSTPARTLSRLSGQSSDLHLTSTPFVAPKSEPKKSTKGASTERKKSVPDESVSPKSATPRLSRSSRRTLELSPRPLTVPVASRASRKSVTDENTSSPVRTSNRKSSVKGDENVTPQPKLPRGSLHATPRQSSERDLSILPQKSDLRKSMPWAPVQMPHNEPKRSNKGTPNTESTSMRLSAKNELSNSLLQKATPRQSRLPKLSVGATPCQSSEPDLSGSYHKLDSLRKSALRSALVGASRDEQKPALGSSPQQLSEAGPSGSSRRRNDVNCGNLTNSATPSPPKRSNTFTLDSPRKAEKLETPEKWRLPSTLVFSLDKVTPPSTSVEVNLRSSRRLSTKKRDSPHTPLTASKVVSHKRILSKSLSAESMVSASPKSSPRNSLPAFLERSSQKSGTSLVQGKAKGFASQSGSESPVEANVKSDWRSSASLAGRSSRTSGTISALSLRSGIRKTSVGKRSSLNSETRASEGSRSDNRRSRASLVGDAAQLLFLSASPGSPQRTPRSTIPNVNVIPPSPTPTKSAGASSALRGPVSGRRSSRKSGMPSIVSVPRGILKTSARKRSSKSETPEASGVEPIWPQKSARSSIKSNQYSRQSSHGEPAAPLEIFPTTVSPPRTSRSSSESQAPVTPPRSLEPEVVMRSSRKTRLQDETAVPSTPTSAIQRRNARRSVKKSPVPSSSVRKKLILASPRKDSMKKLSLDPEKPDKNKMAALIACHKKKSPTKENRPVISSSDEKTSPIKHSPENLTPLKDLDAQPEERSPEDALLDALDLSRKSAIVTEPKRPSRRLRSSTNRRISAPSSAHPSSSKSAPTSPFKSVKKLLFKTPLVEYEGNHQKVEKTPSRSLKGILMPSPTTASEEPMSRVFTTSPIVDFTDASGKKKIFRASPNSKSKVGGIRELVPDEEVDLSVWTLFEASSSDSGSSGRKRKGSEPTDTTPPKKAKTPGNLDSPSLPRSTRRKRAAEDAAVLSSKRSQNVARESIKKASVVVSAHTATTAKKVSSPKSTKRNLQEQFENSRDSPKPSTSKAASPKVSPKQLRRAAAKANATSDVQGSKKTPVDSKALRVKARQLAPVKSPAKTKRAAAKSPKKSLPKRPPRAGKAGTTAPPKTTSSKAKPKKAVPAAKAKTPLKTSGSKVQKSASPAKSPLKPRRGLVAAKSAKTGRPQKQQLALTKSQPTKASKSSTPAASPAKTRQRAKSPTKTVQAAKGQAKAAGHKAAAARIPVKSPPKTRRVAAVISPKKALQKAPPKTATSARPPKASSSNKNGAKKSRPKTAKSPPKPGTSNATSAKATTTRSKPKKVSPSPRKVSPKKTRSNVANPKAEAAKPPLPAKPKATQRTQSKPVPKAKPRLSVPPRPLQGKAVGVKKSPKPQKIAQSPKKSPRQTRSRRAR